MSTHTRHYCIQTLEEAERVAQSVSQLFADKEAVKLGLNELLINAIEHGNLGIGYDEKGILLKERKWRDEIERRLTLPQNKQKSVHVELIADGEQWQIAIQDEGKGFDWHGYMKTGPRSNLDVHGRGITLARLFCFDSMAYNELGNAVWVSKSIRMPLEPENDADWFEESSIA